MKTNLLLLFGLLFALNSNQSFGQKFGYMDSRMIIEKMPEYRDIQKQLDNLSDVWQKEVDSKKRELDEAVNKFKAEEVLLTPDMRKERLAGIKTIEDEVKAIQNKYFGYNGMLFLKRQDLMKPLQDKIYEATEKVAKKKRLGVIFDKSSDLIMLYSNPIYDFTDFILEELGMGDPDDTIK